MKPGGHPIGLRLSGRMAELRNRLSRARYFRGHGVHSPFVYTIVRCERQALCRQLVAAHRSTSVDNRGYLLLFHNYLPKQHFRI